MNARPLSLSIALLAAVFAVWLAFASRERGSTAAEPQVRPDALEEDVAMLDSIGGDGATERVELAFDELVPATVPSSAGAPPQHEFARVFGTVLRDPSNAPSERPVGVSMTDRLGQRRSTETTPAGEYEFTGVAPGVCWLAAGNIYEGRARETVDVPAVAEMRVDLALLLEPHVWVRVIDRLGAPLSPDSPAPTLSLLAVATLEPPGDWFTEVRGSPSNPFGVGSFLANNTLNPAPEGMYGRLVLQRRPPLYVSLLNFQRVLETRLVTEAPSEVTFVVDPNSQDVQRCSLHARFISAETREPFANAMCMVDGQFSSMSSLDANGELHTTVCSPGWWTLCVKTAGVSNSNVRVLLQSGDNELGDIAIERGVEIAGRVFAGDGRALSSSVGFDWIDGSTGKSLRTGSGFSQRTERDGSFRIAGLKRGTYRLTVRPSEPDLAPSVRTVDASSGDVHGVELRLMRAVALVVRGGPEASLETRFSITDASGERVVSSQLWSGDPRRIALAPGEYTLECTAPELTSPKRIPLTMQDAPVELELP